MGHMHPREYQQYRNYPLAGQCLLLGSGGFFKLHYCLEKQFWKM